MIAFLGGFTTVHQYDPGLTGKVAPATNWALAPGEVFLPDCWTTA